MRLQEVEADGGEAGEGGGGGGVTGDGSSAADDNDSGDRERGAKEDEVVTYEQERLARIQRNREALARVGLGSLSEHGTADAPGGEGVGEGGGGGDGAGTGTGDEMHNMADGDGGRGVEEEESLFSDLVLGLPPPPL